MNDFKLGGRVIEPTHRTVRAGHRVTRLRPICWHALMHLVDHCGEVVSIDTLLETVWSDRTARPVDARKAIHEIRAALEDHERQIVRTLPSVGYIIETSSIQDVDPGEEAGEDDAAGLRTAFPGRPLVYGRLSPGAYKSISRRLRKRGGRSPH